MAEPTFAPSVADVASYIRARTKIAGGVEAGTFTDSTRPTKVEVENLLDQAVDHVSGVIGGDPCNAQLRDSARVSAAMYTAILIEVSYFPETSSNQGSSAVRLEALFKDRMKTLASAVAEQCGGQGTGEGGPGDAGALAAGHFSDGRCMVGPTNPRAW